MKIFIFGSTQYDKISKIYKMEGHKVINPTKHVGTIRGKMINFVKIICADTVYCVGGGDIKNNKYLRLASFLRKKIIVHWIGTDVLLAQKRNSKYRKYINRKYINIAVSERLCDELKEIQIIAKYVPIAPIDLPYNVPSMPSKHEVLVYLPKGREKFYGIDITKRIAEMYPEIVFHIVANDGNEDIDSPQNFIYEGTLSSDELFCLYKKCSILFRYPLHDGLPVMMLEALAYGRTVMHRYSFPHVYSPKSDSEEEIIKCFDEIIKKSPRVDYSAISYVNTEFSIDNIIKKYKEADIL